MIKPEDFVEDARGRGFNWYAGVPCSFLTPFINYVINDDTLHYISAANEGDALATAAGSAIGGQRAVVMMQNSGLGNAVSPLTSLAYVFRIPMLIITTHRGAPDVKDEPQHVLMGRITGKLLETMETPWEYFPAEIDHISSALDRADTFMRTERRPYAFLMKKDTVAKHALKKFGMGRPLDSLPEVQSFSSGLGLMSRKVVLQRIIDLTNDAKTVVIATTGYTGRELFALADRSNHLYMVGSMGCASSLGLGLALARPDLRVVVIDGDGAALMRMGNFATLGAYGGDNLLHLVLDNEAHDSTGAQGTVTSGVSFARIAAACGYGTVLEGNDVGLVEGLFSAENTGRPKFGHLKIRTGTMADLPRPDVTPVEVVDRLMGYIGTTFF